MKAVGRYGILLALVVCTPLLMAAGGPAKLAGLTVQTDGARTALSLNGGAPFHVTENAVQNQRTINVPGSSTVLMLWNESSTSGVKPFYAISLDGQNVAKTAETSYRLMIKHREFDPLDLAPQPEAGLAARGDNTLYIVQYVVQPLPEFKAQIEALGGIVRHFQANNAQIIEMTPPIREAVSRLPYVRWVGPFHPAYRLNESLKYMQTSGKAVGPTQRYNIMLTDWVGEKKSALAARIKALGGYVNSSDAGKRMIEATLTPGQLYEVVGWNEVFYVDKWSTYGKDMDHIRNLGGANYLEAATGFHGQGVRAEVFDAGFNLTHTDFQSRPFIQHGSVGSDSHGASTSGIMFGDGTGNALARGMLPAGQGIVGDYNTIGLEGTSRYTHTGEELQPPYFCVLETSSVGSDRVLDYTTISADTDDALFDFDILHCQSQSNAGDQMSRPQAWAKNILSGGALNHYDNENWADDCWCSGASIGPAQDGRIKPDLCAVYDEILTTSGPGNIYTTGFGGTSGATPIIAGHCGLFYEMWSAGLFNNTVDPEGTVFDNRCHMTTAKAVMINTARQYTFTGTTVDWTRVHQGWGFPQLNHLYDMREKLFIIDQGVTMQNLDTVTYSLNVEPSEPEFKATMTYPDPAGNVAASIDRINKLNLKVTAPNGDVYWGNNGLLAGNYSTPGGSANNVDTVENVFVQNPQAGLWVVQIIATEIVADGYVATPEVDAVFSLVVSGVTPCSSTGAARLDKNTYNCNSVVGVHVLDCDLNLNNSQIDTVVVNVASTSLPAGVNVTLTETSPASASFSGTLQLGTTLPVANGDTITLTYIDADNGQGQQNVVVTDTAIVDCQAATISNVQAIDIQPRAAHVTFDASEPVRATVHYGLSCASLTGSASTTTYDVQPNVSISGLQDDTTYYFSVEATDVAGNVVVDPNCYTFTTPQVPDFFTQLFTTDNDLRNIALQFTPNGSIDFYIGCDQAITALPTDPTGGTALTLTDDSFATVPIGSGQHVSLYGVDYTTIYIASNGYITFNSGETAYNESLAAHFTQPRVAALFDDLNPASAGQVSWRQLDDHMAVTWLNVPEYNTTDQNTFQIELYFDGRITINYLAVAATDGLAGLSQGLGQPPDFIMSDLSTMGVCQPYPPTAYNAAVNTTVGTPADVTLHASDEGLPNPPGALTYIITALPVHGTLAPLGGSPISAVPYALAGGNRIVTYTPFALYVGSDSFQFKANDGGTPPEGGDSNIATVTIAIPPVSESVYNFPMDASPGWTTTGLWAFGHPIGGGSHAKDPNNGYTGTNVYGYNLNGDYTNNMSTVRYLTTTPLNFSNASSVTLKFWRWLGVERSDRAAIDVSTNGTTWTNVWTNPTDVTVSDAAWTQVTYDISAVADHQPVVYLRWSMGPTDGSVTYPGWNIDDVQFWGIVPHVPAACPGDTNCDGRVNFADIDYFVAAIPDNQTAWAGYYTSQHGGNQPPCAFANCDINGDGHVNFSDIDPFVALIPSACP